MTTTNEYVRLQARCRSILDELHVPQPSCLEDIVRWTEGLRGRPLFLKELPRQAAGAGACGLWLGTDNGDFVFYEPRTAPLHQEHIILHEIGHIVADHHHAPHSDIDSGLENLLQGLQPHLIRRLMARTSYTTVQEQEAEMLASLMHRGGKPRSTGALGRLGAGLGVRADDRH